MKKLVLVAMALCFLVTGVPAFAQTPQRPKGASAQALEKASDEAVFNRVSDWFATIGKSDEEKQKILAERKTERAAKRAQKEAEKAKKEAQKKTQEAKKEAQKKQAEIEKKVKEQKEKLFGK